MNSVINQFWKTLSEDRFMVLLDCVTNEYASRHLTMDETSLALDMTRAAAISRTFDELSEALKVSPAQITEMLEFPVEVISEWEINGLPEYLKKMITTAIIAHQIDNSRVHTCHRCKQTFVSKDSKEIMCENCKYKMSVGILDRYVQFRIHGNNN